MRRRSLFLEQQEEFSFSFGDAPKPSETTLIHAAEEPHGAIEPKRLGISATDAVATLKQRAVAYTHIPNVSAAISQHFSTVSYQLEVHSKEAFRRDELLRSKRTKRQLSKERDDE